MNAVRCLVLLLVASAGCASPAPARTVFAPLEELAVELSGFPERLGELERVAWEFDRRSVTAHYGAVGTPDAGDRGWIARLVCEPGEQDPQAYLTPRRLAAGLGVTRAELETMRAGERRIGAHDVVLLRRIDDSGRALVIAGTVVGPFDDKYHVVLVRLPGLDERPLEAFFDALGAG